MSDSDSTRRNPPQGHLLRSGNLNGVELNAVFRFVLFCFSFCFVFGGPGGGFGGPGGGFLGSSKSSGKATTETIKKKATTRTTKTTPRTTEDKTK